MCNRVCARGLTVSAAVAAAMLGAAQPALAHPHIWVEARAEIVVDDQGQAVAVRHEWAFDAAYSAWAVQGLDTDGDGELTGAELQPLADDNMSGLADYGYFTFGSAGDTEIAFDNPKAAAMRLVDGVLTLSFGLSLDPPAALADGLEIEVGDPEYYVAFSFEGADAVSLVGGPADCAPEVNPPREIPEDVAARLFALPADVTELPADLRQAARDLANVVVVTCGPAAAPQTAEEAVREMAQSRPGGTPFTAPPSDPGVRPGTPGPLGWVADRQREFYRALTDALGELKTGNRAFWVLGLLSFLYGVFHAAGPGHGKVVITSYMVARERDVLRGVGLSFAAAMMQSLTAVVFVVVAASALRLTSLAMADAAGWMAAGSYALIAALGAWLVWRKARAIMEGGHGHGHNHSHGHQTEGHNHHHDHGDHHHAVGPVSDNSLKEMAGIVFAVGLRPCSGALIVLAFALTQGLLLAGIVATFVMGLGTALTVSVLAGAAVVFKDWAARTARGRGGALEAAVSWLELAAALAVFGFGAVLLGASLQ